MVVVERRRGVLDKACGEGMMPHTVGHLKCLGISPQGKTLRGIRYLDGDRQVDAKFRAGTGRGVRRTVLHAAMLEAAEAAGVRFVCGDIGEITQDGESVCAGKLRARYLAAADGLHSPFVGNWGWRDRAVGHADGESVATCRSRRGRTRSRCIGQRGVRRT